MSIICVDRICRKEAYSHILSHHFITNRVIPDERAPIRALRSGFTLLRALSAQNDTSLNIYLKMSIFDYWQYLNCKQGNP